MAALDYGCRVIPFVTATSTGIQTIAIPSGPGSDKIPKAARIWISGATALDSRTGGARISVGITDGTTHRTLGVFAENAALATDADTGYIVDTSSCIQIINPSGQTVAAEAEFDSFDVGEINIDWISAPPSAFRGFVELFYGDDLNIAATSIAGSSSLDGTVTTSALGENPNLILSVSCGFAFSADGAGNELTMSVGACDEFLSQGSITVTAEDLQSNTSVGVYASASAGVIDGAVAVGLRSVAGAVSIGSALEVTAIGGGSDATFTTRNAAISLSTMLLLIKVPVRAEVLATALDASTTGVNNELLFSFVPRYAGFASLRAANVNTIGSGQGNISIGAGDGTNQACVGLNSRDNQTTSDADSIASNSSVVLVTNHSDTDWQAELQAFSNDPSTRGVELDILDAAGADRVVLCWAFEDQLHIQPTGIASTTAFGTAVVAPGAVDIAPTGIASTTAFGTAVVAPGAVDIAPTGIASTTAFGTATILQGVQILPTGIASTTAFGTAVVAPGAVDIAPTGIASTTTFGSVTVTATFEILPTGIAHTNAFGVPTLATGAVDIAPTGIASTTAFGTAVVAVAVSGFQITPEGIPSSTVFGYALVRGGTLPTTMKKRIHDALCERAHLGQFVEVTYPVGDEGCVLEQGDLVQPRSVIVNEIRGALTPEARHGLGLVLDRSQWLWEMILRFDQEVTAELFENSLADDPVVVCRDPSEPTSRQARLSRVECDYRHPPYGNPSNGTELRYRFAAVLSPK